MSYSAAIYLSVIICKMKASVVFMRMRRNGLGEGGRQQIAMPHIAQVTSLLLLSLFLCSYEHCLQYLQCESEADLRQIATIKL